jgi:curved DNA-binding protein CbpA
MLKEEVQNYYEILGVEAGATTEEITLAYRQILEETNTFDSALDDQQQAIELVRTVTVAYRTLTDDQKRQEYDALLSGNSPDSKVDSEKPTDVIDVPDISLAEAPSLTSAELATLKEVEGDVPAATQRVVYEVSHALTPRSKEEIPEEWKAERAFFEHHYEEILKPGPKVDLIGEQRNLGEGEKEELAVVQWDDASHVEPLSSRFGTIPAPDELSELQVVPSPRREIGRRLIADPVDLVLYVGMPLLGTIILIELLVYMR